MTGDGWRGTIAAVTATVTESPADRLIAALQDPTRAFTGGQVAFLMGEAARWARESGAPPWEGSPETWLAGHAAGYRTRVYEDATYPPPPLVVVGEWLYGDPRDARREWDAAAGWPWRGDYRGGPVEVW